MTLKDILHAQLLLKNDELVAIPTETVYGLGACAYSDFAVEKIYKLKNRTKKNPLICHYFDIDSMQNDVVLNDDVIKFFSRFSPGPATAVLKLKKNSRISKNVTAGLDTVAVRIPDHMIFLELLKRLNFPICAPSANISNHISPTSKEHVQISFGSLSPFILDGGICTCGLESTIVDFSSEIPTLLRYGSLNIDDIKNVFPNIIEQNKIKNKIISPGMLKKHYSPKVNVIINFNPYNSDIKIDNCFVIAFGNVNFSSKYFLNLSQKASLKEASFNLFNYLWIAEKSCLENNINNIVIMKIPNTGIGKAINDRILRASCN